MQISLLAFDADDTLWHSERYYAEAQQRFTAILAGYGIAPEQALAVLHRIEIGNLPAFGYGIKGFILSMVDTLVEMAGDATRPADVRALVDLGRWMTGHEIVLLEHARQTLEQLAQSYPLMLITKGDLGDQERKIEGSDLAPLFRNIEIVRDKTRAVYAALLEKHRVDPASFVMVGNSLRSDIVPVIELGGTAVYVPYEIAWAHEANVAIPAGPGRFFQIASLSELAEILRI